MTPVALGCLAAVGGSVLLNAGSVLQALEAREVSGQHALRLSLLRRLISRRRWLAGTVIGYMAFPLQILALLYAPLVLVQPMHGSGLLLLLGAGAVVLHERVRRADFGGVLAILGGLSLVAWGSPPGNESVVSLGRLGAVTALLVGTALLPFLSRSRVRGGVLVMVGAGLGFAGANFALKGLTEQLAGHDYLPALGWLVGVAIAGTAGMLAQMTAFQRVRAVEVVPVTFAIPTLVPVALAPVLFNDHWGKAVLGGLPFALGALLVAIGILTVARAEPVVELETAAVHAGKGSAAPGRVGAQT